MKLPKWLFVKEDSFGYTKILSFLRVGNWNVNTCGVSFQVDFLRPKTINFIRFMFLGYYLDILLPPVMGLKVVGDDHYDRHYGVDVDDCSLTLHYGMVHPWDFSRTKRRTFFHSILTPYSSPGDDIYKDTLTRYNPNGDEIRITHLVKSHKLYRAAHNRYYKKRWSLLWIISSILSRLFKPKTTYRFVITEQPMTGANASSGESLATTWYYGSPTQPSESEIREVFERRMAKAGLTETPPTPENLDNPRN